MKKLFFAALFALTVAASAFATNVKKVNVLVLHHFESEFKKATDVSWTTVGDYTKATFVLNGENIEAYYTVNGENIGTSKSVSINDLPVNAKRNFAKRFSGYNIKQAIHFEGSEEEAYYISAENENESVIVKVSDNQEVSVFKTTKK